MIQYSHKVAKLAKRREANGLSDVITSVTIYYVASLSGEEAIARCTLDFSVPENSQNFVSYPDVTHEMMIEWSKTRIDYSKFNPDLERQLLSKDQTDEVNFV